MQTKTYLMTLQVRVEIQQDGELSLEAAQEAMSERVGAFLYPAGMHVAVVQPPTAVQIGSKTTTGSI